VKNGQEICLDLPQTNNNNNNRSALEKKDGDATDGGVTNENNYPHKVVQTPQATDIPLEILYEDTHLAVLNKRMPREATGKDCHDDGVYYSILFIRHAEG
jgi:23S rRNA-/tRNA-specific pseudouridylate synthase